MMCVTQFPAIAQEILGNEPECRRLQQTAAVCKLSKLTATQLNAYIWQVHQQQHQQ